MNTTVEKDIHEQLTRLPIERQRQALEFARALAILKVHGVQGQKAYCILRALLIMKISQA